MSISARWLWISLAVFQCLGLAFATADDGDDGDRTVISCDGLHGPTVMIQGHIGRDAGHLEGRVQWLDEASGDERACRLDVENVEAKGAYQVRVTLPACAPRCAPTLKLKSQVHCGLLALDALTAEEADGEAFQVPIWLYNDCRSSRNVRSVGQKREWAGDDMQWLKRSGADNWIQTRGDSPFGYNKKFDAYTMDWLRKRTPEYPWMQKKPTWNAGGVNWLKKRAWNKANAEWLKRGWGNDADMGWLKRGWSSGDVQWLKRSEPYGDLDMPNKRWDHGEIMDWLKKRSVDDVYEADGLDKRAWEDAHTEWIKRGADGMRVHHIMKRDTAEQETNQRLAKLDVNDDIDLAKKNWGASGMSWIKRHQGEPSKKNWGASGMSWIKRDPGRDKRNWGASGMSWIKRDDDKYDDMVDSDNDDDGVKRNWGASGMSWIKRDPDEKRNWGASGMSWIKRDMIPDKKTWGASGMSWIKRHEGDDKKRNWGASGMSWIKRDDEADEESYADDDGHDYESDSSTSDDIDNDKRNWGASGMSWIKRHTPNVNKKNWGSSGMSWIKRGEGEADKRNWGASGMSWIKRAEQEADKRNWGASGMSWIKRDGSDLDKKNWGDSGMSWIKRGHGEGDKRNWGASGMSWIKRQPHKPNKKTWGASGMSWIKRDYKNTVQDKFSVPRAWKTLEGVISSKIVPPLHVGSWANDDDEDWLRHSDRYERHAEGTTASGNSHQKPHAADEQKNIEEAKPQTLSSPAAMPVVPEAAKTLPDSHSSTKAH